MRRLVLLSLVGLLVYGTAAFPIDPTYLQKTPCTHFIDITKIDYSVGTIEVRLSRWAYVYIFGFNTRFGGFWEAVFPRVSTQVRKYPPGCHTISLGGNGKLAQLSSLVIVATEYPCLIYPPPGPWGLIYASQISMQGYCGRTDVIKVSLCPPRPCYTYCPQPGRITYQPCCPLPCNPCTFLIFLLLLTIGN